MQSTYQRTSITERYRCAQSPTKLNKSKGGRTGGRNGGRVRSEPLSVSRLPTNIFRVRPYDRGNPSFTILTQTNPLSEIFKTVRS